ncbi:peptidase G1 [Boletus edulis BED1]|uniref:Peptidase G1 n=1 Tax=Boletus edulis BED1 TaxID=1328754 RepID=A0AAD4GBC3_BOLED|nr:peptidase G1 [Boletus edulis BED1]
MHLNSALISSFLLASVSLAGRPRSQRQNLVQKLANTSSDGVVYNNGFAGPVWQLDNGTFCSVIGTVTIPKVSGQTNSSVTIAVGIDGMACPGSSAILQAGVDAIVTSNGTDYKVWFESDSYNGTDSSLTISASDHIQLTVQAWDEHSGFATITNLNTGQHASRQLQSREPLCRQKAYCGVETMWTADSLSMFPFPSFGAVTFTDAVATSTSDQHYGPQGATMIYGIELNGTVVTSVTCLDDNSVTIKYV